MSLFTPNAGATYSKQKPQTPERPKLSDPGFTVDLGPAPFLLLGGPDGSDRSRWRLVTHFTCTGPRRDKNPLTHNRKVSAWRAAGPRDKLPPPHGRVPPPGMSGGPPSDNRQDRTDTRHFTGRLRSGRLARAGAAPWSWRIPAPLHRGHKLATARRGGAEPTPCSSASKPEQNSP